MIRHGVLPLNALASLLYLAIAALALLALKMASRPLRRFTQKQQPRHGEEAEGFDWDRLVAKTMLKKYTLAGSFLCSDKKYLLKEFVFVAAYGVCCLGINHTILWPLSLSPWLFLGSFLLFDVLLKKVEGRMREVFENKINAEGDRRDSKAEI